MQEDIFSLAMRHALAEVREQLKREVLEEFATNGVFLGVPFKTWLAIQRAALERNIPLGDVPHLLREAQWHVASSPEH